MSAPVISSSYTITDYAVGDQYSLIQLYDVSTFNDWPVSGAFITSSLNSDIHYAYKESGFLRIDSGGFSSQPDSIQYLGEVAEDQIIFQGSGEYYSNIVVSGSQAIAVGDQLTFGAETVDVNTVFEGYGFRAPGTTTIVMFGTFNDRLIGKYIGTDISITAGGAPVSGSSYVITYFNFDLESEVTLRGINPALWPVSGAYIEYQGNTYWAGYDSQILTGFLPNSPPTLGTDTITFISESTTNGEVVAYKSIDLGKGEQKLINMFIIGDMPADLLGYQIEFNSETKYIVGYVKYDNFAQITLDSAFTTSPVGEIYGSGLTLGTAPVTGQILDDAAGGSIAIIALNNPVVNVGDTLTYLGETKTVVTVDQQANLIIGLDSGDSGFSNSLLGKVLGVDILINAGDGGVYTKPTKPAVAKVVKPAEVAEVTKDQSVPEVTKPSVGKVTIG